MTRRERLEIAIVAALVAVSAVCHFAGLNDVLTFAITAVTLAGLARMVGTATEQLGARLGSGGASVVQSALGNLPELFIALFALNDGLFEVVQAALVGSILANSVLVLGIAFIVGGLKNGPQKFNSDRARMVSTLAVLAAATMAIPSLANAFHAPAAAHGEALSLICAGVLLTLFVLTLPLFLRSTPGEKHEVARWSPLLTGIVLFAAGVGAAFTADWFVTALTPAIHTLHMSEEFAGLVIVAIAGNAVENVVGVQLAARNRADFAISVIVTFVAAGRARAHSGARLRIAPLRHAPDARLPHPASARAPDLVDPRRAGRERRRVDLAGRRCARRVLRRDRGELLVGHLVPPQPGSVFNQVAGAPRRTRRFETPQPGSKSETRLRMAGS